MNVYQPHSLLITGGAGFIGSHFIRHLLEIDQTLTIVNLDKLTYAGTLDNLKNLPDPARHQFIQGDINHRTLVQELLQQHQIYNIIHFSS